MARPVQQWSLVLALMFTTSLVESIGISQVFALGTLIAVQRTKAR